MKSDDPSRSRLCCSCTDVQYSHRVVWIRVSRVKLHPKSIALRDAEMRINKAYSRIGEAERDMRAANGEGTASDGNR